MLESDSTNFSVWKRTNVWRCYLWARGKGESYTTPSKHFILHMFCQIPSYMSFLSDLRAMHHNTAYWYRLSFAQCSAHQAHFIALLLLVQLAICSIFKYHSAKERSRLRFFPPQKLFVRLSKWDKKQTTPFLVFLLWWAFQRKISFPTEQQTTCERPHLKLKCRP